MKKLYTYILLMFISAATLFAQDGKIIIGAEGKYNLPVGSLANRFNGGTGGTFYLGTQVSDKWTWTGKLEYYKLDDENSEKLFKKVEAEVDTKQSIFKIPLDDLTLELTVAGVSAEAKYNLFRSEYFETDLNAGFGFFYWETKRSAYKDSVFVEDSQGRQINIANFDVPVLSQKDWSGALNFGIDVNVKIFDSVWLTTNVNYRLLITELWPTLALDVENVSGLQFINFGSGVRIKL